MPLLNLFSWGCQSERQQSVQQDFGHEAKLTLGHHLFFERRLSATGTKSCASCHDPGLAFTDGYRRSPGIYGDLHPRNTPSLINIASQHFFNRANPDITTVSAQMEGPLFGKSPVEMGLDRSDSTVLRNLDKDGRYHRLFRIAFPGEHEPVTWEHIKIALETYVLSLESFDSPYDRYMRGDKEALSYSAREGAALFFSDKYRCGTCHKPPLFGVVAEMTYEEQFANIGLYNYKKGNYPLHDQGLYNVTGKEGDKGRFKIPSLRNIAFTAPYFHDGSAETLDQVLDVYEKGGRDVTYGNWPGDGRKNPNKHALISPIEMSRKERYQLLDFLASLNDSTILSNPHFHSPFRDF